MILFIYVHFTRIRVFNFYLFSTGLGNSEVTYALVCAQRTSARTYVHTLDIIQVGCQMRRIDDDVRVDESDRMIRNHDPTD